MSTTQGTDANRRSQPSNPHRAARHTPLLSHFNASRANSSGQCQQSRQPAHAPDDCYVTEIRTLRLMWFFPKRQPRRFRGSTWIKWENFSRRMFRFSGTLPAKNV